MRASRRHIRRFAAAIAIGTITIGAITTGAPGHAQEARIAMTAIVEHPSLDAVRNGITDVLARAGYLAGANLNLRFESAEADAAKAAAIAAAFAAARPDVIVTISAPSAQTLIETETDVPIVVVAIGEADAARILGARTAPGGPVTGVVEVEPPLAAQLALVRTVLPEVTTVTVPYDRDDPRITVERLEQAASAAGLDIEAVPIAGDDDLAAVTGQAPAPTRAIYLPPDSLAAAKVEAFFTDDDATAYPAIFAGTKGPVVRGALATIGYDPYEVGRQAGRLVLRILGGEDPATLAMQPARATHLVINVEAAELMGITLPAEVLDRASETIEASGPRPRSKPPAPDR